MSRQTHRRKALEVHGEKCSSCGSTENLHVHHIDRDKANGDLDNLEVLCKECHWDKHRDEVAERASGPQTPNRGTRRIYGPPSNGDGDKGRTLDHEILDMLRDGRVTAPFVSHETDYSLQYVRDRLTRMVEHGNARKVYDGLYELVEDPRGGGSRD